MLKSKHTHFKHATKKITNEVQNFPYNQKFKRAVNEKCHFYKNKIKLMK